MIDVQTSQQLAKLTTGGWITQAVYVAADLGIADLLIGGPLTVEELAQRADVHPDALYRVLRALATVGILTEDADRRFSLTPNGRVLLVETVIPPQNEPCFGKWLDLMMLIVGGRERTQAQYRQLFSQAGLTLSRIVPTAHEVGIIEGIRAA